MPHSANKLKHPVLVIGGGWSGLATACYLAAQNIPVTLIESAKQLGGRARKSSSRTQVMDNGQHLMIGAYSEMLALMEMIGVDEKTAFLRTPHQLKLIQQHYHDPLIELKLSTLPKPLNLLAGMLLAKGLSFKQKFNTLKNFNQLLQNPIDLASDKTVSKWLSSAELPDSYKTLLESLCLAALNTHANKASAYSFQNVLNQTFNGPEGSTDLLFPLQNLGQVFPAPARVYLSANRGKLVMPEKISCLNLNEQGLISDARSENKTYQASAVVLATAPHIAQQLMNTLPPCDSLCQQIGQFEYNPITTVYLKYPDHCKIDEVMIGLDGMMAEWVFDRRICDQPGFMAVVISSHGKHMELENKDLSLMIIDELATIFPHWPKPTASWVIREKRATFACTPQSHALRPGIKTPVENLFLTGDYLNSDSLYLPATLETTIRNAKACAEEVINYLNAK